MVPSARTIPRRHSRDSQHAPQQLIDVSQTPITNNPQTNYILKFSLRIDDIEDNPELRRGFPSTHTVFGIPQTINTANLVMFKALKVASTLSPAAMTLVTDRIIEAHLGQGMDLHWTRQTELPSEKEYFAMVDGSKLSIRVSCVEVACKLSVTTS